MTSLLLDPQRSALTAAELGWSVTEQVVTTPAPGTVLAQNPVAETLRKRREQRGSDRGCRPQRLRPIEYAVTITTKNNKADRLWYRPKTAS